MDDNIPIEIKRKPQIGLSPLVEMTARMVQLSQLIESAKPSEKKERAKSVFAMLDEALAELNFDD